ncbi:DedA family protein [Streptomyces sp. NBC_01276]|uniref:DedA family protein n=1 Tax=Streptomyces sp. NBC_01276 TaxID=2903808 RepID=UPI00352D430C
MQPDMNAGTLPLSWWILALALAAVFGDSLLPVLPSGTLVVAAAAWTAQHHIPPVLPVLAVAAASFLGDLALVLLARRGSSWLHTRLDRHPAWRQATTRLQGGLARHAGRVALAARFVPAGRTVLDIALGTSPALRPRQMGWSALAGLLWAAYLVTLGHLGNRWFDTAWLGLAVSVGATVAVSTLATRMITRPGAPASGPSASPVPASRS